MYLSYPSIFPPFFVFFFWCKRILNNNNDIPKWRIKISGPYYLKPASEYYHAKCAASGWGRRNMTAAKRVGNKKMTDVCVRVCVYGQGGGGG